MTEEEREAEQVRIWNAIKELVKDLKKDLFVDGHETRIVNRIRKNAAYLESCL